MSCVRGEREKRKIDKKIEFDRDRERKIHRKKDT